VRSLRRPRKCQADCVIIDVSFPFCMCNVSVDLGYRCRARVIAKQEEEQSALLDAPPLHDVSRKLASAHAVRRRYPVAADVGISPYIPTRSFSTPASSLLAVHFDCAPV
jgi:hypothetical protein